MKTSRTATAIALVLTLGACGNFAKTANKTLHTALAATNGAKETFIGWDERHQLEQDEPEHNHISRDRRLVFF